MLVPQACRTIALSIMIRHDEKNAPGEALEAKRTVSNAVIKDALEFLAQMHGQLAEEATRYRNYEWKITGYVIAVFIWLISVVVLDPTRSPKIFWFPYSKIILGVILLFVTLFHTYAVFYTHSRLYQTRQKQNQLESLFARHYTGNELRNEDLVASLDMRRIDFRLADLNLYKREGWGSYFVYAFIGFVWIVFILSLVAISHAAAC